MRASVWYSVSVLLGALVSLSACAPEGSQSAAETKTELSLKAEVEASALPAVALEAEELASKTTGEELGGAWALMENGWIEDRFVFPVTGEYEIAVTAAGDQFEGTGPEIELRLDDERIASSFVSSSEMSAYVFRVRIEKGERRLAIAYVNDISDAEFGDRNLYVDKISFRPLESEDVVVGAEERLGSSSSAGEAMPESMPLSLFNEDAVEYWSWDRALASEARLTSPSPF